MTTAHGKEHQLQTDSTGWPICSCGWLAYNPWFNERLSITRAHIDLEHEARR